jgi:hypothetical protein
MLFLQGKIKYCETPASTNSSYLNIKHGVNEVDVGTSKTVEV